MPRRALIAASRLAAPVAAAALAVVTLVACAKAPPRHEPARQPAPPPRHETARKPEPPPADLARSIRRQAERAGYVPIEELLDREVIRVTPGMTILDVGAGAGRFTFAFARRLAGTGMVFATDVLPDRVSHLRREVAKAGTKNVTPVLVKAEGFDPFHRRHSFDLVYMCNVFHRIDDDPPGDRVRYLEALRRQITPTGRLVVVIYRQVPPLTAEDFANLDEAIRDLGRNTSFDPFYQGLAPTTRARVDRLAGGGVIDAALRQAVIEDLNRLLATPTLYRQFFGAKFFTEDMFNEHEREFANWLLLTLREERVLTRPADRLTPAQARAVRKLNSLFAVSRFRRFLRRGRLGVYVPRGDINRQTSSLLARREFEAAGYGFEGERELSPYFTLLTFAAHRGADAATPPTSSQRKTHSE